MRAQASRMKDDHAGKIHRPLAATPSTSPVRVPFSAVDEAIHHLDRRAEPWSIQIEVRVAGGLDERRLRLAVAAALTRHPMARARQVVWRAAQHGYDWEIAERCDLDPFRVVECEDDAGLAAARSALQSLQVPLVESPPLRVWLAHHPGGDVVMLNVSHTASDGLGAFRIMRSLARAYAGVPDPVPDLDPLSVRDLRVELAPDSLHQWVQPLETLFEHLRDASTAPPARIAADGGSDRPGYGFHLVRLTRPDTAALVAKQHGAATVNDLLLAAFHIAIAAWNEEHDEPCGRIGLMMPVNMRPRERWHEMVANLSLFVRVSTLSSERVTPAAALQAVVAQTRRIKERGTAAALMGVLGHADALPLWIKRALPALLPLTGDRFVDTAVLSNLGRVDEPLSFGADAGEVIETWFSPPARMPLGVALGAVTMAGQLHLGFRYRYPLFDAGAAARFATRYVKALTDVSRS